MRAYLRYRDMSVDDLGYFRYWNRLSFFTLHCKQYLLFPISIDAVFIECLTYGMSSRFRYCKINEISFTRNYHRSLTLHFNAIALSDRCAQRLFQRIKPLFVILPLLQACSINRLANLLGAGCADTSLGLMKIDTRLLKF